MDPTDSNTTSTTCGFDGDGDAYGLGIRAGVYVQWVSTLLVYNFLPEEATSAEGANLSFQLSLFIALIYRTVGDDNFYAVEAYVMLTLCIGGLCSRRGHYAVRSTARQLEQLQEQGQHIVSEMATPIGLVSAFAVDLGILCYGLWFFYAGMDGMQTDPCSAHTVFFFARVQLQGWFRQFVTAALTVSSVYFCLITWDTVRSLIEIISSHQVRGLFANVFDANGRPIRRRERYGFLNDSGSSGDDQEIEHTYVLSIIIPLDLALFILSNELTISYNSIREVDTVNSTGQLIPIVVGATSLLVALYQIWLKLLAREISEFRVSNATC